MDWVELYFQIKVIGFFAGLGIIALWALLMLIFAIGSRR